MRLHLVLLAFVALAPLALGQTCDDVTICLDIGESNCREPGHHCRAGSYCNVDTSPDFGTCERSARLGEACSNDGTKVRCYDSDSLAAIYCNDEDLELNGTCVLGTIFAPGESCFLVLPYDTYGGCILGTCEDGKCSALKLNETCSTTVEPNMCGPGLFCNFTSGNCEQRRSAGYQCSTSLDCDYQLICTARGGSKLTCQAPWLQVEGQGCSQSQDCASGLYCGSNEQCIRPSAYEEQAYCTDDDECQHGWGCQCHFDYETDRRVAIGGKCSVQYENTKESIKRYNDVQACLKQNACQDLSWHSAALVSTLAPDSCLQKCFASSGYMFPGITPTPEDKCFVVDKSRSLASVAAPLFALLLATTFATMMA